MTSDTKPKPPESQLPTTRCGATPYAVHRSASLASRRPAASDRAATARRLGAWLFRHRTYTLAPLAVLVVATAFCVSTAPAAWAPWAHLLRPAALAMLATAAAIRFHVAGHARRGTSSRGVTFEAGTLVTTGTYAVVRNPLYVANVLVWSAMAAMTGCLPVALLVAATAAIHFHLIVLAEEHYLAGRYGDQYVAYRRRVPRWLPRPTGRRPLEHAAPAAPFRFGRGLFREADTLLSMVLGAWFVAGISLGWTPWNTAARVPAGWYLLPLGPTIAWLAVKGLKKSRWSRSRHPEP